MAIGTVTQTPTPTRTPTRTATVTPSPTRAAQVYLDPIDATVEVGDNLMVDVMLDTGDNANLGGVAAFLQFDPNVLEHINGAVNTQVFDATVATTTAVIENETGVLALSAVSQATLSASYTIRVASVVWQASAAAITPVVFCASAPRNSEVVDTDYNPFACQPTGGTYTLQITGGDEPAFAALASLEMVPGDTAQYPGDADRSCFVNDDDFRAVRDGYGTNYGALTGVESGLGYGDADNSNFVNGDDIRCVREYFGQNYGEAPTFFLGEQTANRSVYGVIPIIVFTRSCYGFTLNLHCGVTNEYDASGIVDTLYSEDMTMDDYCVLNIDTQALSPGPHYYWVEVDRDPPDTKHEKGDISFDFVLPGISEGVPFYVTENGVVDMEFYRHGIDDIWVRLLTSGSIQVSEDDGNTWTEQWSVENVLDKLDVYFTDMELIIEASPENIVQTRLKDVYVLDNNGLMHTFHRQGDGRFDLSRESASPVSAPADSMIRKLPCVKDMEFAPDGRVFALLTDPSINPFHCRIYDENETFMKESNQYSWYPFSYRPQSFEIIRDATGELSGCFVATYPISENPFRPGTTNKETKIFEISTPPSVTKIYRLTEETGHPQDATQVYIASTPRKNIVTYWADSDNDGTDQLHYWKRKEQGAQTPPSHDFDALTQDIWGLPGILSATEAARWAWQTDHFNPVSAEADMLSPNDATLEIYLSNINSNNVFTHYPPQNPDTIIPNTDPLINLLGAVSDANSKYGKNGVEIVSFWNLEWFDYVYPEAGIDFHVPALEVLFDHLPDLVEEAERIMEEEEEVEESAYYVCARNLFKNDGRDEGMREGIAQDVRDLISHDTIQHATHLRGFLVGEVSWWLFEEDGGLQDDVYENLSALAGGVLEANEERKECGLRPMKIIYEDGGDGGLTSGKARRTGYHCMSMFDRELLSDFFLGDPTAEIFVVSDIGANGVGHMPTNFGWWLTNSKLAGWGATIQGFRFGHHVGFQRQNPYPDWHDNLPGGYWFDDPLSNRVIKIDVDQAYNVFGIPRSATYYYEGIDDEPDYRYVLLNPTANTRQFPHRQIPMDMFGRMLGQYMALGGTTFGSIFLVEDAGEMHFRYGYEPLIDLVTSESFLIPTRDRVRHISKFPVLFNEVEDDAHAAQYWINSRYPHLPEDYKFGLLYPGYETDEYKFGINMVYDATPELNEFRYSSQFHKSYGMRVEWWDNEDFSEGINDTEDIPEKWDVDSGSVAAFEFLADDTDSYIEDDICLKVSAEPNASALTIYHASGFGVDMNRESYEESSSFFVDRYLIGAATPVECKFRAAIKAVTYLDEGEITFGYIENGTVNPLNPPVTGGGPGEWSVWESQSFFPGYNFGTDGGPWAVYVDLRPAMIFEGDANGFGAKVDDVMFCYRKQDGTWTSKYKLKRIAPPIESLSTAKCVVYDIFTEDIIDDGTAPYAFGTYTEDLPAGSATEFIKMINTMGIVNAGALGAATSTFGDGSIGNVYKHYVAYATSDVNSINHHTPMKWNVYRSISSSTTCLPPENIPISTGEYLAFEDPPGEEKNRFIHKILSGHKYLRQGELMSTPYGYLPMYGNELYLTAPSQMYSFSTTGMELREGVVYDISARNIEPDEYYRLHEFFADAQLISVTATLCGAAHNVFTSLTLLESARVGDVYENMYQVILIDAEEDPTTVQYLLPPTGHEIEDFGYEETPDLQQRDYYRLEPSGENVLAATITLNAGKYVAGTYTFTQPEMSSHPPDIGLATDGLNPVEEVYVEIPRCGMTGLTIFTNSK